DLAREEQGDEPRFGTLYGPWRSRGGASLRCSARPAPPAPSGRSPRTPPRPRFRWRLPGDPAPPGAVRPRGDTRRIVPEEIGLPRGGDRAPRVDRPSLER